MIESILVDGLRDPIPEGLPLLATDSVRRQTALHPTGKRPSAGVPGSTRLRCTRQSPWARAGSRRRLAEVRRLHLPGDPARHPGRSSSRISFRCDCPRSPAPRRTRSPPVRPQWARCARRMVAGRGRQGGAPGTGSSRGTGRSMGEGQRTGQPTVGAGRTPLEASFWTAARTKAGPPDDWRAIRPPTAGGPSFVPPPGADSDCRHPAPEPAPPERSWPARSGSG